MDPVKVNKALAEAKDLVSALETFDGTLEQHSALLTRSDNIRTTLETPYDLAIRYVGASTELAALNTLIGIDGFEKFDKLPVPGRITASDLASQCNIDVSVIARVMRTLVRIGIFDETGPSEYAHNELSRAFHPKALGSLIRLSSELAVPLLHLPNYLNSHKPEDLYDPKKTPFVFTAGHEGKTYYELLDMNPKQRDSWNLVLQSMAKDFPILGMFPFEGLESQVKENPERPFIVDIGGGRGQALLAIQKHCGGSFGSEIILQDLPGVIDTLRPEDIPGIRPMAYDAFTEQPVKGAHVYLMRRLLHDFYDLDVIRMVRNTVSAMTPESRLVICDMLVPDRVTVGGPATLYWLDLSLLAIGGKERTLDEFRNIFDEVGLELVNVYPSQGQDTAMLEARLRRQQSS